MLNEDSDAVALPEASVRLEPGGVICIDFRGCRRITLDLARQVHAHHRALCPDHASPVLMTGEQVGRVDYAAQRFVSTGEVCQYISAMAIVAHGFLPRHLARMFLLYHRPPYPAQVFSDEATARAWLGRQVLSSHA